METRQLRMLLVLAGVLLALTGVLWLGDPEAAPFDPDATALVVQETDITKAVSAEIRRTEAEREPLVTLEKRDGIWHVTAPYVAEADPDVVIEVLDAVRESNRGVPVEGEPEAFGLVPPRATITVGMEDGSKRVLAVGITAPGGTHAYALTAEGGVAAVPGRPADPLLRRVNEYRDHRVFQYDPGEVTRISIESDVGRLEATRTDGGWFLTDYSRVDLNALDEWVVDFMNIRVDLFLDLEVVEPDAPRFTLEVETPAGVQRAWVGRDTPYGPLLFEEGGLNGPMQPQLLEMLKRRPRHVGTADAFPMDEEVQTIRLSGARAAAIQRSGDSWSGTDDAEAVASALIGAQLFYGVPGDPMFLAPPDWSGPELTVTLVRGDGTERAIEVGAADPEGFRPVRDTAGGVAVRVPAEELAPIFGR